MKVKDIFEMTMRTGTNMEHMPFPNFEELPLKSVGRMQHGYEVFSMKWKHTVFFIVKVQETFASFCQLTEKRIPKVGIVYESLNSKTLPEFKGQKLSVKLKHFITLHLGLPILLGNIISVATETLLPKLAHTFNMKIVNVKTGELVDWSVEKFNQLTSTVEITNWQVLLVGAKKPLKEDKNVIDWSGPPRHLWTYADFFSDLELIDELV